MPDIAGRRLVVSAKVASMVRSRPSRLEGPCDIPSATGLRFSVVIPAFNEERLIGECLQSLARQDFAGGYEVIVVDNNCSDDTADIARLYGATVVREDRPGVCAARQSGTAAARGQIVVSSDADTMFDTGWLTRIDRMFRQDPARVAVAGPCRYPDGPWWGKVYVRVLFELVHLTYWLTSRVGYITATNVAFRKDVWSGYDLSGTQGADELGLLRQLRSRGKVVFDRRNPTFTSARRLTQGLTYNVVVSFLFYYALAFTLNGMTGRTIIGTAPAFRNDRAWPVSRRYGLKTRLLGIGWLVIAAAATVLTDRLMDS
ncbi:MAG TPA: glycosyltransferase family 2 protein [Amycolatopsis sp.]|jgi:glycosyltransferase involved in cell wall biosynthesis